MTYTVANISALTDIPPLVHAFAGTNGFTVTGSTSAPIVSLSGKIAFQLSTTMGTYDHDLKWTGQSVATSTARIRSPKLNGTISAPVTSIPSKVHLFSDGTFIHIVVEYGFNSYRHLYYGHMDILGGYTGGEVIAGSSFNNSSAYLSYPIDYRHVANQYLFTSNQSGLALADCGGVNVNHADNPTPWRRFRGPSSGVASDGFTGVEALGGFKDDVNDGYLARGFATYAGVNLLVPINLYTPLGSGSSVDHIPIGRPAGIRMVNMTGIEPGEQLTIGSENWRCFPAFRKSDAQSVAGTPSGWGVSETSYVVGYALLED